MKNFYSDLGKSAFWKSGLADVSPLNVSDIYKKKWDIGENWQIGTAGSCFAQHIARHLTANGYNVLDAEPAPSGLKSNEHQSYGYSLYSGRYGNIYTTRQFRQLIEEVFSDEPESPIIWEKDGKFFDALRPNIEPNGFASQVEVIEARAYHRERLRELFLEVDMFVFTLGLTEAWIHTDSGRVVPLAPGVVAGGEEAQDYSFINFSYADVVSDFRRAMTVLRENRNKQIRYLLTVSPVPLTATASGNHVLTASTYSKSVLRAAAGFLSERHGNIDYFPSYEIITNPAARSTFFASNLRSVMNEGVEVVMKTFFAAHPPKVTTAKANPVVEGASSDEDVQCDEEMLEAFGK
ncbi:GSCFA domain-containing protein [Rhodalgimonas zhirmunskyi]|uniref:GSCFA domain-containing protein n=1 Tax=Rhodalgimonas zhirmunskyi TaxID=2964767 RepID=A0AAJ1X7B7_9RHOB|nr:GSCFA domain-containing protein [Rhodoalgimonas zhirmunskyi]MDQ2094357.1 GSCFA domain-containing protein [Rhodoalgimonas zhirmunskyi]